MNDPDEFYVGYLEQAPAGIARFVRRRVVVLLLAAALLAVALAVAQSSFEIAFFDFGAPRTYEGTVRLMPHPVLQVPRPGGGTGTPSSYLLVGFGKAGAAAQVEGFVDRRVRLEATPIYRDDQTMLEVVAGTVAAAEPGDGPPAAAARSLGRFTLEGEIIDSKCHLGVMKPGSLKAHRACASLCIRGGVPPMLILRRGDLPVRHLLLVGAGGEVINDRILDLIAEPVRVTGEVLRQGDLWVLRVDPAAIERLS